MVSVERATAPLELRRIDGAHTRLDTGALEIAYENKREALLVAGRRQDFKR